MKTKRKNVSFSLFCSEYSLLHPLFVSIVDVYGKIQGICVWDDGDDGDSGCVQGMRIAQIIL